MKYLKMLGLAAVAAAALMAFAGAGTASADELCTEPAVSSMCPAGKIITALEASLVGSAKLEDSKGNTLDTCTAGEVKITDITTSATGTSSLSGTVTAADLTWGTGTTPCTFTTTTTAGGTVHGTPAAGGGTTITATNFEVTINSPLGDCKYTSGASLDLGNVANGGRELAINVSVAKTAGALCPSTAKWNATYKVTNHTAVYYIDN